MRRYLLVFLAVVVVMVAIWQLGGNDDIGRENPSVLSGSSDPGPPSGVVVDATPTPVATPTPTSTPTPGSTDAPEPAVPEPESAPEWTPTYSQPEPAPVEGDVVSIIHEVFGQYAGAALAVAWCESRFNPGEVGAAGEKGLFQIHPVHWSWLDPDRLFDPLYNTQMAFQLSKGCTEDGVCGPGGSDWSSWTCKP